MFSILNIKYQYFLTAGTNVLLNCGISRFKNDFLTGFIKKQKKVFQFIVLLYCYWFIYLIKNMKNLDMFLCFKTM